MRHKRLSTVRLTCLATLAVLSISHGLNTTTTVTKKPPPCRDYEIAPPPPRKKDMRLDKLNRLLGLDFNPMWMSKMSIPLADRNVTDTFNDKPALMFPDNIQFPERLPEQYREMVSTWVVRMSSCSVEFTWTNVGKSFWPKWIKLGRCGRSDMMSCSWPSDMSCMSSSTKVLNILRWHCWMKNKRKNKKMKQERKMIESMTVSQTTELVEESIPYGTACDSTKVKPSDIYRCMWIKVPYPVIEECKCSGEKIDE